MSKVKKPKKLTIQNQWVAFCTHDARGIASLNLIGHLIGANSARKIAMYLLQAADWIEQEGGG